MTSGGEIVLYVNQPYTKFRWLGYISAVQAGFVLVNFLLMPTPELVERTKSMNGSPSKSESENDSSGKVESSLGDKLRALDYAQIFSPRNAMDNIVQRPVTSIIILLSLPLVPTASYIFCKRLAHQITLLQDNRIRFTYFSPFGLRKPASVEIPLRDISCVQGRKAKNNFSILKVRGHLGYHLVHKQGQFLEPKLYDLHLGYAKSWASKS